jgi:hypothetical protein
MRDTSAEAAAIYEQSGKAALKRREILRALESKGAVIDSEFPAMTASEVFKVIQGYHGMVNANIPARLSELRHVGQVMESGKKVCPVTGRTVIAWRSTLKPPVQPQTKMVSCDACNGTGTVEVANEKYQGA